MTDENRKFNIKTVSGELKLKGTFLPDLPIEEAEAAFVELCALQHEVVVWSTEKAQICKTAAARGFLEELRSWAVENALKTS